MSKIEARRGAGRERVARKDLGATDDLREAGSLELVPPPAPECGCREALRRLLTARDRYLAALGDGTAPFKLPEEDEYLEALAAARGLCSGG
jgi:hypothetical protein